MKRIELIIPHRELREAHEILKGVNTGYYIIEGSSRIKADPITIGRGTMKTQPDHVPRPKIEVVVNNKLKT